MNKDAGLHWEGSEVNKRWIEHESRKETHAGIIYWWKRKTRIFSKNFTFNSQKNTQWFGQSHSRMGKKANPFPIQRFHVFSALAIIIQFTYPFIFHSYALTYKNLKTDESFILFCRINWRTFQMVFTLSGWMMH